MILKNKIMSVLSIIIFNLLSCSYATTIHPQSNNDATIQDAVLVYINEYRQRHGLPKLTMNPYIVAQAKVHSQDMASNRMGFSHSGFDTRIAKLRQQVKDSDAGAENIAYNYKSAREVVDQWVRSPGHLHNIVGQYNLTGVGVARDKLGKIYYTQIFLHTGKKTNQHALRHARRGAFFSMSPFITIKRNG